MAEGPLASDAERERVVGALERHFADGRLTAQEFSERLECVLRARTLRELYELTGDLPELPMVEAPLPGARSAGHRRWWRRG